MKVRLPFTYRTHYFAIPGISEWIGIQDMTNGMKIEYDDLGSSIKIHREEDRITEEREFPAGTRRWERARLFVSEWSFVDEEGKPCPICWDAYKQLDPTWCDFIDDQVFIVNPTLGGKPARPNPSDNVEGEIARPTTVVTPAPEHTTETADREASRDLTRDKDSTSKK